PKPFMSDVPDILNTPVLPAGYDAFWKDEQGILDGLTPKDTLFITPPIAAGSLADTKLQAIIKACGLSEGEYHIIQLHPEAKIAWHLIRDTLKPKYIVMLGIELSQLALSVQFMPHQVSRFDDRAFIPTFTIEQVEEYPDIKRHFWLYGLKPVFIDKVY